MSKIEKLRTSVLSMTTLTTKEKNTLIGIIDEKSSIWVKILKIIKYLGSVAGFILAGIGASASTNFLNM